MKKLVIVLLIILIIIAAGLIGGGAYLYFKFKPFLADGQSQVVEYNEDGEAIVPEPTYDEHPLLTPDQEKILESVGVDPAKLPSELTPAMEECFVGNLGVERVNEIKGGAEPSLFDFLSIQSCLTAN